MTTLHHALGLLQHDAGNLYVAVGRLVEGRGNHLGINRTGHVGYLLRTLVNEQHHDVCLRMVGGYSVGYVLHQNGLTRLWLGHDERTLTLTDGREQVNDTHAGISSGSVATKCEFLVGEEWGEVFEGHAVAHLSRLAAVDAAHVRQGEILLVVVWWTYRTFHNVARLQTVFLDLLLADVDVVG